MVVSDQPRQYCLNIFSGLSSYKTTNIGTENGNR